MEILGGGWEFFFCFVFGVLVLVLLFLFGLEVLSIECCWELSVGCGVFVILLGFE